MTEGAKVEKHYASGGITARVLTALRNVAGQDVAITPDTLAPIDHFHGRGVVRRFDDLEERRGRLFGYLPAALTTRGLISP